MTYRVSYGKKAKGRWLLNERFDSELGGGDFLKELRVFAILM